MGMVYPPFTHRTGMYSVGKFGTLEALEDI